MFHLRTHGVLEQHRENRLSSLLAAVARRYRCRREVILARPPPQVNNVRLLRESLVKKGWKQGAELRHFKDTGAEHNERAWAARFGSILTFLFSRKR